MSLKEQASRAISLLSLYELEGNSIERIISIVQNNQKYFGVRLGNSALEAAANKLEQLVADAAEPSVQLTAFGTGWRVRLGYYLIRLGCRLTYYKPASQ